MSPDQPTDLRLFEGRCIGGPLDGETAASRFPAGFVLADRPAGRVWLYDRRDDGTFVARAGDETRDLDAQKIIDTALGDEYDVIAAAGGDDDDEA